MCQMARVGVPGASETFYVPFHSCPRQITGLAESAVNTDQDGIDRRGTWSNGVVESRGKIMNSSSRLWMALAPWPNQTRIRLFWTLIIKKHK